MPNAHLLSKEQLQDIQVVSTVFPFKTSNYVVEHLIDWENIPEDPIFQLTFPQREMLDEDDYNSMQNLFATGASDAQIEKQAREIRQNLNPHPSGQMELNIPFVEDKPLAGMQHKYHQTVLFFPSRGQTCHAYCTYCFRWAQFTDFSGRRDLRFASHETESLCDYLRKHPEVTDVLITGGDPLVMRTKALRHYIDPLLTPEFSHINLRIGTKALSYWPYRFTQGEDADSLLRLFEEIATQDRNLAIMAHYTHPRELHPTPAQEALSRVLATGATVRCQGPVIRHINDSADTWAEMTNLQVKMGAIPYYMFIERNSGASRYFDIPLAKALEIYMDTCRKISGLGKTLRGPVMSATPGKVAIEGKLDIGKNSYFVLKMLQARDPQQVNKIFLAEYNKDATWFDDLNLLPDGRLFPEENIPSEDQTDLIIKASCPSGEVTEFPPFPVSQIPKSIPVSVHIKS